MLVENGLRYSRCPGLLHPHFPALVVLEQIYKDADLPAVFGERSSPMGLVMDKILHDHGNEWRFVIVVVAVHMGLG